MKNNSKKYLKEIEVCSHCRNYYGESHEGNKLICALHPYGFKDDFCPDYNPNKHPLYPTLIEVEIPEDNIPF